MNDDQSLRWSIHHDGLVLRYRLGVLTLSARPYLDADVVWAGCFTAADFRALSEFALGVADQLPESGHG